MFRFSLKISIRVDSFVFPYILRRLGGREWVVMVERECLFVRRGRRDRVIVRDAISLYSVPTFLSLPFFPSSQRFEFVRLAL